VAGTYEAFLAAEAANYLSGLKRQDREPIRQFIDLLTRYPHLEGEITERDKIGRTVHVKLLRRIKLVYWADHADRSIKILRIERVGR